MPTEEASYSNLSDVPSQDVRSSLFTVFYTNVRSLRSYNKFTEFTHRVSILNFPDILVLTETWLKEGEDKFFQLKDYSQFPVFRKNRIGGGILIYVKSYLQCNNLVVLNDPDKAHQVLTLELSAGNSSELYYITAVYNPNVANAPTFLDDFYLHLESIQVPPGSKSFIAGDFNIDLLNSNEMAVNYMSRLCRYSYVFATQSFPTRISLTSASLIDHICCSVSVKSWKLLNIYDDLSDHNLLLLAIKQPAAPKVKKDLACKTIIDYKVLNNYLSITPFNPYHADVNQAFNGFHDYMHKAIASCSFKPRQAQKYSTCYAPWMTRDYLLLCKAKSNLFHSLKLDNSNQKLRADYRNLCNQTLTLRRNLQKLFIAKKLESTQGNSKIQWQLIQEILTQKKKTTVIDKLVADGKEYVSNSQLVEVLNEHFVGIPRTLASNFVCSPELDPSSYCSNLNTQSFQPSSNFQTFLHPTVEVLTPVTPDELKNTILTLKLKHYYHKPNIPSSVLINCLQTLLPSLLALINLSFQQACFPDILKKATTTPIFKSGSRQDPGNYRPISQLPALEILIEKIVKKRLINFLNSKGFFANAQYGFLERRSTASAVFDFIKDVQYFLDNKIPCGALFIDLAKAFDTVNHSVLLQLLGRTGLDTKALSWLKSYLYQRSQVVRLSQTLSNPRSLEYGVPQGSVLGPILFLVIINSLDTLNLNGKLFMFADDISILYSASDVNRLMAKAAEDCDQVWKFLKSIRLSPNAKKTKVLIFKTKVDFPGGAFDLSVDSHHIEIVDCVKFLGLNIESDLSWSTQVSGVLASLRPIILALSRLRRLLPRSYLRTIYFSLVQSRFSYLLFIWGRSTKAILQPLITIQNWAVRTLFGYSSYHPVKDMYRSNRILPVELYVQYSSGLFMYKILNNLLFTRTSLTFVNQTSSYNIRSGRNVVPPHISTSKYGSNSVIFKMISEFNNIPLELRNASSYTNFKSLFLSFLLDKI